MYSVEEGESYEMTQQWHNGAWQEQTQAKRPSGDPTARWHNGLSLRAQTCPWVPGPALAPKGTHTQREGVRYEADPMG